MMTLALMSLCGLLKKSSDADLLRERISFASEPLIARRRSSNSQRVGEG